jgi:hypothetical protein
MNRAFLIVLAPALLVGALALAMNYGRLVPRWVAFTVAAVALTTLLWQMARKRPPDAPGR